MQRRKTGKISIFNSLDVIFDFLTSRVEYSNWVSTQDQYQIESECWNRVFELSQKIDIEYLSWVRRLILKLNLMISLQMLNDVNKINIELKVINIKLKATQIMLNVVQTRLQKEMKKKNMIIHHLKVTSSRLSTLISKDRFLKSIKLFDSSLFKDSRQNMNNWLFWMWNKLKMNKNHFSIEEIKIAYVKSWVSETMIKHIALRMKDTVMNSFLKAEEILSIINKMYDDFNWHHTAQQQFLKLYQNKIFFHEFWMKFQRLSAKLEYNNETLLNDLQHKISSDLQQVMINKQTMNLNEFIDICMQVNVWLTKLNAWSALKTLMIQVAHFIASILTMITTAISALIFAWKKLRILNVDSAREKLFKKNFASNARSQNIEHVTVLNQLRCTKLQRIWKTTCLHQSSNWEWYTHILLHQHVWWFI